MNHVVDGILVLGYLHKLASGASIAWCFFLPYGLLLVTMV
jgi:hypothetical protein